MSYTVKLNVLTTVFTIPVVIAYLCGAGFMEVIVGTILGGIATGITLAVWTRNDDK